MEYNENYHIVYRALPLLMRNQHFLHLDIFQHKLQTDLLKL